MHQVYVSNHCPSFQLVIISLPQPLAAAVNHIEPCWAPPGTAETACTAQVAQHCCQVVLAQSQPELPQSTQPVAGPCDWCRLHPLNAAAQPSTRGTPVNSTVALWVYVSVEGAVVMTGRDLPL